MFLASSANRGWLHTRWRGRLAWLRVAWGGVLLVGVGCAERLQLSECEQLLDRYTEQLMRSEQPGVSLQHIATKQLQARELAQRDPQFEFEACPDKVSRRQFQCAMSASDVDSMERCLALDIWGFAWR